MQLVKWEKRNKELKALSDKVKVIVSGCASEGVTDFALIGQINKVNRAIPDFIKAKYDHHLYDDPTQMVEDALEKNEILKREFATLHQMVHERQGN